jgi:hypothetical protein
VKYPPGAKANEDGMKRSKSFSKSRFTHSRNSSVSRKSLLEDENDDKSKKRNQKHFFKPYKPPLPLSTI